MNIWLVSPAWRRYDVTRLALAERRWLCEVLAARGWTANSVVVADDDNQQIARELGFHTLEMPNTDLGEKFNAGYLYAASHGADVVVHIGSDDWLHPDALTILDRVDLTTHPEFDTEVGVAVWSIGPTVAALRRLTLVDLVRGVAQRCQVKGSYGCIPWLVPRPALSPSGYSPIQPGFMRGIDGALVRGMGHDINWIFQEHAPAGWCVDFKTHTNITPYNAIASSLGMGPEGDAYTMLAEHYPAHLVDLARETAERMAA